MSELSHQENSGSGPKINWEDFLYKNRYQFSLLLIGAILIVFGALFYKKSGSTNTNKIEVLDSASESQGGQEQIVVQIAGAVEKPGVYTFEKNSRVEDLMISAGGISADADREWVDKVINRAAKLVDGQKYYIPSINEQSDILSANVGGGYQNTSGTFSLPGEGLMNINSASQKDLESLSGIGPVYAQKIIEHRPYSTLEELVSKGAIRQFVFEKIKGDISVY